MRKNLFAFLALFLLIVSCKSKSYFTQAIEGEQMPISLSLEQVFGQCAFSQQCYYGQGYQNLRRW